MGHIQLSVSPFLRWLTGGCPKTFGLSPEGNKRVREGRKNQKALGHDQESGEASCDEEENLCPLMERNAEAEGRIPDREAGERSHPGWLPLSVREAVCHREFQFREEEEWTNRQEKQGNKGWTTK